jgi:hypothetical protein
MLEKMDEAEDREKRRKDFDVIIFYFSPGTKRTGQNCLPD